MIKMLQNLQQLKPCPFCGEKAVVLWRDSMDSQELLASVECVKCTAKTETNCKSREEAVEAWNKRVGA